VIALISIPLMGQIVKATLNEDGTWTATDKAIEATLAVTCDPREDTGPSSPPFGMVAVEKALLDGFRELRIASRYVRKD
jgi:hypothetical protein